MWFFRKRAKKGKKGQNIWKFEQKYTKFENILKKGWWLRAIIAQNKLQEKALQSPVFSGINNYILFFIGLKDIEKM